MQAGLDRRWWNDKNVKSKVSANIATKSTLGNFYHRQMINDLGVIVRKFTKYFSILVCDPKFTIAKIMFRIVQFVCMRLSWRIMVEIISAELGN